VYGRHAIDKYRLPWPAGNICFQLSWLEPSTGASGVWHLSSGDTAIELECGALHFRPKGSSYAFLATPILLTGNKRYLYVILYHNTSSSRNSQSWLWQQSLAVLPFCLVFRFILDFAPPVERGKLGMCVREIHIH
jgi:hypothetical protein